MGFISLPSSRDIYIEINGRKLAVAQGYRAKTSRESRYVEEMGTTEPVGTIAGRIKHVLELSRVMLMPQSAQDEIDFHSLLDFNVVIVKPDRRIVYTGCQWADINENVGVNDMLLESVTVIASKRVEMR